MIEAIKNLWETTGLSQFENTELLLKTLAMYVIVGVLVYLAVVKGFEPLLLLPIATGMLLANLPGANLFHMEWFVDGVPTGVFENGVEILSTKLSDVVSYAIGNGGLL
ncbi:MAG: sodium ion-translocating decarboxylase subunit beta, partial [Eubacteriales bacterium]